MHKIFKLSLITLALSALMVSEAYAESWTYDQGFDVGCEIGEMEQGVNQFRWLMTNTETMAANAGEFQYAAGVVEGYFSCRFLGGSSSGNPRDGMVWCTVDNDPNQDDCDGIDPTGVE